MERLTEWRNGHGAIVNNRENYIDKLARYEDAEEQGRLFVVPFKIGDKAYIAKRGRIYELIIENITQPVCYTVSEDGYRDVDIYMNDVGRYVFKTREEAEAALKEATP